MQRALKLFYLLSPKLLLFTSEALEPVTVPAHSRHFINIVKRRHSCPCQKHNSPSLVFSQVRHWTWVKKSCLPGVTQQLSSKASLHEPQIQQNRVTQLRYPLCMRADGLQFSETKVWFWVSGQNNGEVNEVFDSEAKFSGIPTNSGIEINCNVVQYFKESKLMQKNPWWKEYHHFKWRSDPTLQLHVPPSRHLNPSHGQNAPNPGI